jgi:hypothetical protein
MVYTCQPQGVVGFFEIQSGVSFFFFFFSNLKLIMLCVFLLLAIGLSSNCKIFSRFSASVYALLISWVL